MARKSTERYFRRLSKFYAAETDKHPGGLSQHKWIIPTELTSNTWDTAPGQQDAGYWANVAWLEN